MTDGNRLRRYGANLLFQYGVDGQRVARALCEKRIVVIEARTPSGALRKAKRCGRAAELSYRNADGDRFRIRFLGLVDLVELVDADESYYAMFRTSRPAKHLPGDDRLSVFRTEAETMESAWWAVPRWAVARSAKRASKPVRARPPQARSRSKR